MKLFLAALISSFAISAFADSITGEYRAVKEISVWAYTKEECLSEKGNWDLKESLCKIKVEDTASIQREGGSYRFHMATVGSNFHSCEFDSPAKRTQFKTLVSKIKIEVFSLESGSLEKATCKVTAKVDSKGVMKITTNQKCQSFCGANSSLEAQGLIKLKK